MVNPEKEKPILIHRNYIVFAAYPRELRILAHLDLPFPDHGCSGMRTSPGLLPLSYFKLFRQVLKNFDNVDLGILNSFNDI